MKFIFAVLSLIFIFSQSVAQKRLEKYVVKNLKPINSIQSDFADDSDLEEISKAIGDSRIVMLGEQNHGDGAAFVAKTRLVKYLHEKKGFKVLAFESDFFALNHGWEVTAKERKSIQEFLRFNVYPYWSRCKDMDNLLYDYIPNTHQTENPLQIAGFDNQLYMRFSRDSLRSYLTGYLKKEQVAFADSEEYENFFLPFTDTLSQPWLFANQPDKDLITDKLEKITRYKAIIDSILAQLPGKASQDYQIMLLHNLKELAEESYHYADNEVALINTRDAQMAKNLEWLVTQKYPSEKIIVWAANFHVSKGRSEMYLRPFGKQFNLMGSLFTQNEVLNKQTYVLGFASKTGVSKRTIVKDATTIPGPTRNSFESWIDDTIPYAFVDFKSFREKHPNFNKFFLLKGYDHLYITAVWSRIFDGIFYIRDMTPCEESEFEQTVQIK